MDSRGYLVGLMVIISGLAITEMLTRIHQLVARREQVRWDWLALCAIAFVMVALIAGWWITWRDFRGPLSNPHLAVFALFLAQLSAFYLASRAVVPDNVPDSGIDLTAHYAARHRHLWTAMAATFALLLLSTPLMLAFGYPGPTGFGEYASRSWPYWLGLAVTASLAIVKARRYHAVIVPLLLILTVTFSFPQRLDPALPALASDAPAR